MSQKHILSIIAILAGVTSVSIVSVTLNSVQAQEETFSANLSGKDEVPPTESNATGWAKFQSNDNGTEVSYWINITGLKKITGAHIHNGSAEQNGDIVVALAKEKSAKDADNPTISLKGNLTKDDLQGPLKGKEVSELVSLMTDGNAYVNAHTDKYQKGAIRGQITTGESQMGSTPGSNSTSSNEG
jgi:hypothetical protein